MAQARKSIFSSMSARTADEANDDPDDVPSSAHKVPSRSNLVNLMTHALTFAHAT